MFRRNKKTQRYQAPFAKVTHMELESNFCETVRFNVQVRELTNINKTESGEEPEPMYFEF